MKRLSSLLALSLLALLTSLRAQTIPTDGFADAIHHWQNRHGKDYPRYLPDQSRLIAENILLLQRANGGWPENLDPLRILSTQETTAAQADKHLLNTSFDNRNAYSQVEYLARAFAIHQDERYRQACLDGLRYILDAQLANGGFTHSPPRVDTYRGYITFADEIMPSLLATLRRVADKAEPFQWLQDETLVNRAAEAVARGDQLILDLQIRQDGKLAAWAGQYHPLTLQPVAARSYELPSILAWESVAVVEYLMRIPDPSPETVAAIEAAAAWFDAVKLSGLRIEEHPITPVTFTYHTATFDRVLVQDPAAPPIWARFYDLENNAPILATRDGKRVSNFSDIPLERRSGYNWYGHWPAPLLQSTFPAWKKNRSPIDSP